uniref:Uncharacterized protein n=1 Tax=Arundo donax TaxID=35708 RepID=A0A0A9B760_ARUDO
MQISLEKSVMQHVKIAATML